MRMSQKCRNINKDKNNSDNSLTSRRTDGGKKNDFMRTILNGVRVHKFAHFEFSMSMVIEHIQDRGYPA